MINIKSMKMHGFIFFAAFFLVFNRTSLAQDFLSVMASINQGEAIKACDRNKNTGWQLEKNDLKQSQSLMFVMKETGYVDKVYLQGKGITVSNIRQLVRLYITYDPMNLGEPLPYEVIEREKGYFVLTFSQQYGSHLCLQIEGVPSMAPIVINEVQVEYAKIIKDQKNNSYLDKPWMNPALPINERVEKLLAVMTPEEKMELLREGWGIPGIPRLGIPFVAKVEAIHGFSYGSGATIFPQAIGLGATWNRQLVERVASVIGDETVSAHTVQAWSPVLDVAQDARWGRCEETYGEDPVLVSEIGGAWIKGFQSRGLITTPKHFAGHGAPLGGRDSHDIGLSEREMREIHLVPFRNAIKNYHCQSIMANYSDYLGVPVIKNKELLKGILREEWGFDGFIVSDCGAVENLTSKKHYTAVDLVDAANQALAAGITTNCGDTYSNKEVIEAAKDGRINMENLNWVCRGMLAALFRNGLFDYNLSQPLDWNKIYPGWNSPEHQKVARQAALESIVLLKNKGSILPLSKGSIKSVAVIGPGADDLQPGDYTAKLQPGQLKSVLFGIKEKLNEKVQINYVKGCAFTGSEETNIAGAVRAARKSEVILMVLGDCSTSEAIQGVRKTSGEANDYATLILPGDQQKILEAVCKTGKPVVLILQIGRPYNLSYASEHCQAILVNWLPGQEGGRATADVLFGDYNPAGRLPMTFPRNVGQLPLYYNFKTSGRGYHYVDMDFYPLYSFGYGLSYTHFKYSGLKICVEPNGIIEIKAIVTNEGNRPGDEVVQLYVTDMYACVKTRLMELKDFTRINLAPGDSKEVTFHLTPYQLSLLNDRMDRVVEPGQFKILVGGHSPTFKVGDKIKDSVSFQSDEDGVSELINYPKAFSADFNFSFVNLKNKLVKNDSIYVKVSNKGNLTDTGKLTLFANGIKQGEDHSFELDPGEERLIQFNVTLDSVKEVTVASKYKCISYHY